MFAPRYYADDSRVRDDLRRFLPDNVLGEFAAKAAPPWPSTAYRWRAEAEQLAGEEPWLRDLVGGRAEDAAAEHRHARRCGRARNG